MVRCRYKQEYKDKVARNVPDVSSKVTVDAGAVDAHEEAQVDRGPCWLCRWKEAKNKERTCGERDVSRH